LDAENRPILDSDQITDDALGGRAYYLGRAELEIPLGSGLKDLGLRPSLFVDVGSVFGLKNPITQRFVNGDERLFRPRLNDDGLRQCTTGGTTPVVTPVQPGVNCPEGASLIGTAISGPFEERYLGDTWKPRLSVGFGVNWNSPFGPLRIDIAKALLKYEGDDTKLFTFNVGTAF
jgi:outer membrane protein insertion porin family